MIACAIPTRCSMPLENFRSWVFAALANPTRSSISGTRRRRTSVGTPESAMFPSSIIPLEHDFARGVVWVDIDIGEQNVAGVYGEALGSRSEEVLMEPGADCGLVSRAA